MTHTPALKISLKSKSPDRPVRVSVPAAVLPLVVGEDRSQSRWMTSEDGVQLFVRCWRGCAGAPVMVYLHGIEGHGEWFASTATHLSAQGISIYAPDRRGAGRSQGDRGHVDSHRQWIGDAAQILKEVRQEHPHDPLFLVANCWGARTATALLREEDARSLGLSGLVLISPAISVLIDLDPIGKLAVGWSWVTGSRRRFPLPISIDMFTDDPAYIDFIEKDPLRLTEVTASFFVESLKLSRIASASAESLELPLLILQAGRDRIVKVDGTEDWYCRNRSADKQMYIFSWSEHSLDFDAHRAEYARCMAEWLFAHAEVRS